MTRGDIVLRPACQEARQVSFLYIVLRIVVFISFDLVTAIETAQGRDRVGPGCRCRRGTRGIVHRDVRRQNEA